MFSTKDGRDLEVYLESFLIYKKAAGLKKMAVRMIQSQSKVGLFERNSQAASQFISSKLNQLLFPLPPPPGPDSPGEPDQVPHPALAAAAGEALPGEAGLSGVELALRQPVL